MAIMSRLSGLTVILIFWKPAFESNARCWFAAGATDAGADQVCVGAKIVRHRGGGHDITDREAAAVALNLMTFSRP